MSRMKHNSSDNKIVALLENDSSQYNNNIGYTVNNFPNKTEINSFSLDMNEMMIPNDLFNVERFEYINTLFKKEKDKISNELETILDIDSEIEIEKEILKNSIKQKKKYNCEIENCKKIYKSKENLTLHIKNIHEKIKPYRCRFCDFSFSHRNGKTYHERRFHINYLPYKCIQEGKILIYYLFILDCRFSFASKSAMSAHYKSSHLKQKRIRKNNSNFVKNL